MRPEHRFIGASVATMPGSVIEQLLAMRKRILRFNLARRLRTALLYTGGWFVQWHEGPEDEVDGTWKISRSHDGHREPRVVHRSDGPVTLVEPVQIAALFGPLGPQDVARKLEEIEREQRETELAPAEIWRRLAAPPHGRFAANGAEPHRAIAVVSASTEAVELIKALGERCRAPVAYQRFAGPDLRSHDAGAAYVDVGCSSRRTRVQALSLHALPLGVARLAFTHVNAVVVLVNRQAQSARALAEAVAPFIAEVRPVPAYHVIDTEGRRHTDAVVDLITR